MAMIIYRSLDVLKKVSNFNFLPLFTFIFPFFPSFISTPYIEYPSIPRNRRKKDSILRPLITSDCHHSTEKRDDYILKPTSSGSRSEKSSIYHQSMWSSKRHSRNWLFGDIEWKVFSLCFFILASTHRFYWL